MLSIVLVLNYSIILATAVRRTRQGVRPMLVVSLFNPGQFSSRSESAVGLIKNVWALRGLYCVGYVRRVTETIVN